MDNTLSLKLKALRKALLSLEETLRARKSKIVRDSIIKRFEYSFELCWKTAKLFLREKFGVNVFSPKECFRELRKNKLISDEETELLLKMTDDRNEIIHTYNENFSNELYNEIVKRYYSLIVKVYNLLKNYKNF